MAEIDGYLGKFVRIAEPRGASLYVMSNPPADMPPTRDIDLRGWFRDAKTSTYRRRDPHIPTQSDCAVDAGMIARATLRDAALMLEAVGLKTDRHPARINFPRKDR